MKYLYLFFFLVSAGTILFIGLQKDPKIIPSNLLSQETPSFILKKLDKKSLLIKEDFENPDEIKILNFFATWCPPCKVEHEQLMKLSRNYNVFGIAKKDKSNDVLIWLKKNGDPYKKLGLDQDGLASIEWGVYGLPETFLIDKQGKIIYKHVGPILKKDLKDLEELINTIK
tara:strand:+ start:191 stop:703 length:513 start_codon:yes stop_codon:yes gene_type:complete